MCSSDLDQFRYPKAGTTNPLVSLVAAEVGTSSRPVRQLVLPPPASLKGREAHFTSVAWADHDTVAVNWMNRVQNVSVVSLCPLHDTTSGVQCREVLVLPERDGWVDYKFKPKFNPATGDGNFLAILPAACRNAFAAPACAGAMFGRSGLTMRMLSKARSRLIGEDSHRRIAAGAQLRPALRSAP